MNNPYFPPPAHPLPQVVSDGRVEWVQCYPLRLLLWAALGRRAHADLLVVDTTAGAFNVLRGLRGAPRVTVGGGQGTA